MHNNKILDLELTSGQLSLWIGQKLYAETPLHNSSYSFEIKGILDESVFKKAFQETLNSTEALRTIFIEVNNSPIQRIKDQINFEIDIIDRSTERDISVIKQYLLKRSTVTLDISKCIFDSVLIKLKDDHYFWLLNVHHLVTDAVAQALIFNTTQNCYNRLKNSDNSGTSGDSPSFKDFIDFEKLKQDDSKSIAAQNHWKEKTKELLKIERFYGKKPTVKTTAAQRIKIHLGAQRAEQLRNLSKDPEIRNWTVDLALYNIFTTIFSIFLSRVSGQKQFAIGSPNHNRTTKQFQETVGCFVELFPLAVDISEDDSFMSLLTKLKVEINSYLKNVHSASVTPEISRSFNTVLNYINVKFQYFAGIPTQTEWIPNGHIDAAHYLRCHIVDFDNTGEIDVIFDFNTGVFDSETISKAPTHFLNILDAFLENKDQLISETILISEDERKDFTSERTSETAQEFTSIIEQFEYSVKNNSDSIALRYKNQALTFNEVNKKSNQLAHYLKNKGITTGKRVALHFERSIEYIISVLAVLKTGATFIPIPSDQPANRISYITEDSECALLLYSESLTGNFESETTEAISLDLNSSLINTQPNDNLNTVIEPSSISYLIYTSGSTGKPKGVLITNDAVSNYLNWAKKAYSTEDQFILPLFTSIGFDLTISATFLPLITGGEVIIYKEGTQGPDISLIEVLSDNKVNGIKLTPSHLTLLQEMDLSKSAIRTMIVGGEDFKTNLAISTKKIFSKELKIFNEYGPTEATVGCIVSLFDEHINKNSSVFIGTAIDNTEVYLLDSKLNLVPKGVVGELFISGKSLAEGYANLTDLTNEKFITNPFREGKKMYRTGDLARCNSLNNFEYLGRVDEQVKLGGFRIELSDIEANMIDHKKVTNAAVVLLENKTATPENEVINCSECGLPSNYPNTDFDTHGVCHLCNAFKGYKNEALRYFKTEDELKNLLLSKRGQNPHYDCLSLLSGGKDSTYILAQLIGMGLKVLAFTLDNGYISDQAKANVDKIVSKLKVDHIYGTTEYMNEIFVDSLHRHKNVCNGCFKTIYTLSTEIALAKKIPFVITGLSRGQFFETRLTEELFWDKDIDVSTIDKTILEARKLYHKEEDAVKDLMDVSMFNYDDTFDKVQFIDFYRYSDVSLGEMLSYLKETVDWVRPTDTGRSTNCTINQVGIYVHKKELGYSNYSFPYSWDVRMGHKTRTETLEEINEHIDEKEVKRIMSEIGYQETSTHELSKKRLVGYYTAKEKLKSQELSTHLKKQLPEYMIPSHFKYMAELPLTNNGKVDKFALKAFNTTQLETETDFVAPEGEIEELLTKIWKEVLRLEQVGVHDDFIVLGGHSLAAIRVTARINEEVELKFPLNKIFELPTISQYASFIEKTIISLMDQ